MAGAYWHFYTANRAIERLESMLREDKQFRCILEYRSFYLAGVQGPDFNFYPGGDGQVSKLAHGSQPADLGRSLLKHAGTDQERAFAYGWLMHLTTDNITHPLVNRLILEHFPGQTKNGTDPFAYPLGHHRVEWGIDVQLIQTRTIVPYLPDVKETLGSALLLTDLVAKALQDVFQFKLPPEAWQESIRSMIRYLAIFEKAWLLTGRIRDKSSLKQAIKDAIYHTVIMPVAKLIALRNPENGAGVVIPVQPTAKGIEAVLDHAEQVCHAFETYIQTDFQQLPNDTG